MQTHYISNNVELASRPTPSGSFCENNFTTTSLYILQQSLTLYKDAVLIHHNLVDSTHPIAPLLRAICYRLPTELRAFLGASDGFSLTWTAQRLHFDATARRDNLDVVVGRIRINSLSAIKRLPLDSDDLSGIASSRARAAAATAASSSSAPLGGNGGGKAYGLAAFSLDSLCEVGVVALVYGGAPLNISYSRQCAGSDKLKGASVAELTNPEVWLQDLSCR